MKPPQPPKTSEDLRKEVAPPAGPLCSRGPGGAVGAQQQHRMQLLRPNQRQQLAEDGF